MGIRNQKNSEVDFITEDPHLLSLLKTAQKVAITEVSVLVHGESGTGKEVLARRIHRQSKRCDRTMISLNCGALQENILLSELFGHEKGAFTGAVSQKPGLVELADGGTLFLDEIGELGLETQAKLLRFLQNGEFYRVGGKNPIRVNTRLLSATNRDLMERIRQGKFRQDLFYRIHTVSLKIPPLRQRRGDIALLAGFFLSRGDATSIKGFSDGAMDLLKSYSWPGNVRELQNTVERFKILGESAWISREEVSQTLSIDNQPWEEPENTFVLEQIEKRHILKVLAHFEGNKTRAATAMGITVKTLYNKLARYQQEHSQILN